MADVKWIKITTDIFDYEKILLTAKKGSSEFNNALSDLTYATLEAQFASVGLEKF